LGIIIVFFAQKNVGKLFGDLGSGKNLSRITDPGVKKEPDPGFQICQSVLKA
jgi:hypothetical protein